MAGARKAIWVLILLAGLLLSLLLFVLTTDLGRFQTIILDYASSYLERQIDIDGPLSIQVGREVRVTGQRLRVASTNWTDRPELLTVEHFSFSLDTWSIIRGVAFIDEVSASGIRAHLVVADDGNGNWTFSGLSEDGETTPVVIRKAAMTDAQIHYTTGELPPVRVALSRLTLNERPDAGLDFELLGSLNEAVLAVAGMLGTVDSIVDGHDVRFRIDGHLGEITIAAAGLVDDLYNPARPEVEITLQGPNAEYLTDILGIDPVTSGEFSFKATASESSEILAIEVDGVYGEFNLALSARLADLRSPENLELAMHANGPSIRTITRLAGLDQFPEVPFSVDTRLKHRDTELNVEELLLDMGAATLKASARLPNFPAFDGAQADIVAAGPEFGQFNRLLGLPGELTGPFTAVLALARTSSGSVLDARLESDALQWSATGTITDNPDLVGSEISISTGGGDAALVAAALGFENIPAESFAGSADLTISDRAIEIANGKISFGRELLLLSGRVGHDPMSSETRLRFDMEVADLKQTLIRYELPAEFVPGGGLTLAAELFRGNDEFLLDPLEASFGDIESRVTARIGDALTLPAVSSRFEILGHNLPELLSLDGAYLSNAPFKLTGRAGFRGEESIELEDLEIAYGTAEARATLSLFLPDPSSRTAGHLEVRSDSVFSLIPAVSEYLSEDTALNISAAGQWRDGRMRLQDVIVRMGEASLQLQGELRPPPEIDGTDLTLQASLPSAQMLELISGQPLPNEPLTVSGTFVASETSRQLTELAVTLGKNDLSGAATYQAAANSEGVPEVSAELTSRFLDLRLLQAAFSTEAGGQPSTPEDNRLIPDTQLPLDQLQTINGSFQLTVDRALTENADLREITLAASLREGALLIEKLELGGAAGGKLSVAFQLTPSAEGADIKLEMDGRNLTVGLPAPTPEARQHLPRYELSTRLAASGSTMRELATRSRGYLRLVSGEGDIALGALGFLMRDFAGEVFDSINPFAKQESSSKVQCLAVLVEVDDGIVTGKPAVVLQTDKLNIVGVGRVDLASEKLKARFNTQARQGIGISMSDLVSPLTEIGGTLSSPKLQLDTAGTVVRGGAAVATMGISFLAKNVTDRWFADRNPCRTAVREADRDLAEGGVPLTEPNR